MICKKYKRLPRKLKKRVYGKRGRRKHLASALLLDNPELIKRLVDALYPPDYFKTLNSFLTESKNV